uniref:Uncharacterized protein n=1 Tax=Anguilla anguilla TaxID=7936 RepID=A0A0E9RCM3_ANGAN
MLIPVILMSLNVSLFLTFNHTALSGRSKSTWFESLL